METWDVIIVGSGPAGLMCAVWLARRGVKVTILEKRQARPSRGRADGFEPRTLEILDSFGLLDTWWRRANRTVELSVHRQRLERILRRCNSARGTSRFYEATMDQAVLEQAMEEYLAREHGVFVQYATDCLGLGVETKSEGSEDEGYPVALTARRTWQANSSKSNSDGKMSTLRARYLVGADGSRSWTRNQVGIRMLGSRSTRYWGVADIVPLSDFPDMRNRCIIHKEHCGTVMTIPREAGMVRLYVQLGEKIPTKPSGEPLGPAHTIGMAQRILEPFKLETRTCYWHSFYRVEQTLASSFSAFDRVFLLGDAIHTHSPKVGMGLNVSIQDAHNLGWKLAAVVNGEALPTLLTTYENDRRPVAQFLLDFDQNFQRFFHEPLNDMDWSVAEYRNAISEAVNVEHADLSGISACHIDEHMYDDPHYNESKLATGIPTGKRLPSATVVNQADGRAWDIQSLLCSNGNWRLILFPGDLRDPSLMRRYVDLGNTLRSHQSPLNCFISDAANHGNFMDIFTIHSSPRDAIDLLQLPEIFHPWSDERGWDYEKVFADDETYHDPHGHIYRKFGICHRQGCALLVRPDHHVCMIMEIERSVEMMTKYLKNWLYSRPATGERAIEQGLKDPTLVARL